MTRKDDNHKTASIVKSLEERLADLEEKDRTIGTPNVLRTHRDRVSVSDEIDSVEETGLVDLRWNDVPADFSEGYGETAYGETPYGEAAEISLDPGNPGAELVDPDVDGYGLTDYGSEGYGSIIDTIEDDEYGGGGYGEGGYGGVIPSVWTLPSNSGWGYGMWGRYQFEPDPEPVDGPQTVNVNREFLTVDEPTPTLSVGVAPEPEPGFGANTIHQWTMSEGSGIALADVRGDDDGVISGADWDSSSHDWYSGHALSGNGTSDYVDLGVDNQAVSQIGLAITVVHPYSDSNAGDIANLVTSGFTGDTPWEIRFNGYDLEFSVWDGTNATHHIVSEPISTLSPNHPHRIVCQYGDGTMEMWVDGTLVGSVPASINNLSSTGRRLLFAHDDAGTINGYFGGILDNFAIFDGPLSADGVQADLDLQPWPVDNSGGPVASPTTGDVSVNGVPQPNSDGPFGIYEGDVPAQSWSLHSADDFEGTLAESNWSPTFAWGGRTHGGPPREYCRDQDVFIGADNCLTLQTQPDSNAPEGWYGGAANTYGHDDEVWPEGSKTPDVEGTHGFWEACIKMPAPTDGFIPGFWSRGADSLNVWPPEVDFVERFGEYPAGNRTAGTVHYDSDEKHDDIRQTHPFVLSDNFHVYGCYWTDSYCEFYLDGVLIQRSDGRSRTTSDAHGPTGQKLESQDHYSLFTNHVWPASWNGYPDTSVDYPIYTKMDWFRFWNIQ